MKRLILLASAAAAVVLAAPAPAHADTSGNDAGFLATLDQAGITHRGAARAVAAGRSVCELMDDGLSPMDTVTAVQGTNPGFTMESAAKFTAAAVTTYCPEHF
jgi:hypothetical protein